MRVLLIAIFSIFQLGLKAEETHVVFDVMNTLVREVPRWLAPNLDQNKVITFNTVDRRDSDSQRDYFFMKMHYVEEMMTKVANTPGVKIYFYSGDQQFLVDPVLKELKLTDGSGRTFLDIVADQSKHILYRKDTVDTWDADKVESMKGQRYDKTKRWKKDLKKLGIKAKNAIMISPIDEVTPKKQKGSILYLGHPLFYAKSYADAKGNRDRRAGDIADKPWIAKHYPNSKEEWENDFYKNAYVYLILKEIVTKPNLHRELKTRIEEERNHLTKVGMRLLDGTWKVNQHHFVLNKKKEKVVGCQYMENRHRKVLAKSEIADCLQDNETDYDWLFFKDKLEVEHCVLRDAQSGAFIENRNIAECIKNKSFVTLWQGQKRNQCAYFTDNLYFITPAKKEKCSKEHLLYQDQSHRNIKIEYFDGMESLSLEEIFSKLSFQTTVSLSKFNSTPQSMSGIQYPRLNHIMYRGMGNQQMSLEKTFKAIWADLYSVVESKIVTLLKHYLMGKTPPVSDNYGPINLRNLSQKILADQPGPHGHDQALRIAIEALDQELQNRGDTALRNELIDQYSGTFNEWGGAGLYTAPFYNIAKLYGTNVVVFREKEPRGADKTYFEYMKYNNQNWPRVDSGEYIIPLYIPANEIEGMHIAASYAAYSANPWQEAFYKITYQGKTFIMAVSARGSCVQKESDGLIYNCQDNFVSSAFPNFPTVTNQVEAKAIFALCPTDTSCSLPKGLAKKFKLKGSSIDSGILSRISSMRIFGGKRVKAFYKDASIGASDFSTL